MKDNNVRVYTLKVFEATAVPSANRQAPAVVLEIQGALSRKAKREITEALTNDAFEIREKKHTVI